MKTQLRAADGMLELVGDSDEMGAVRRRIARLKDVDATVLVRGPTGSGKEVAARALHAASRRRTHPFIPINVNAIPEALFESQLFGHVAGAFTGARGAQPGFLEQAGQGTVMLDEIGDLSMTLQAKLLRLLEQRAYYPVGGVRECSFEARMLAATHVDLEAAVRAGRFREDLYHRLTALEICLPALSKRRGDIRALVHRFASGCERPCIVDEPAMQALIAAPWPGNVRQLKATVERLALFNDGKINVQSLREDRAFEHMSPPPPRKWDKASARPPI